MLLERAESSNPSTTSGRFWGVRRDASLASDPTHPEELSDPLPGTLAFSSSPKKLASTNDPARFASPRAALEEKKRPRAPHPTETHSRVRRPTKSVAPHRSQPHSLATRPSSRVNETTAGVWGGVSRETTKSSARLRPRAHLHLTDLPHASFSPSQSPAGTARGCRCCFWS